VIETRAYRNSDHEPTYAVPGGKKLTLTLDGAKLAAEQTTDVSLFGPGYTMGVYDVELEPKAKDTIEVSADWKEIVYKTDSDETPVIEIGISTTAADYEFEVHALGETGGQRVRIALDPKAGTMTVEATAKDGMATYEVEIHRIDDRQGARVQAQGRVERAEGSPRVPLPDLERQRPADGRRCRSRRRRHDRRHRGLRRRGVIVARRP
jgi:hypothetical protein